MGDSESLSINEFESLETERDISNSDDLLMGSRKTLNSASSPQVNLGRKSQKNRSDNENILIGDTETVVHYREKYQKKCEEELTIEANKTKYLSIKDLGDQILESKIYKIQSLFGSKKQRKKFFGKLNSSVIDNDIKERDGRNNVIDLCIPDGIGSLKD